MKTITVDLHTHLIEKREKPERYWKAVKAKKLDAVAITEHADCKPEKAYQMLLEKKPRAALLLPGMELRTNIGHVLAFGKSDEIFSIEKLFEKKLPIKKAVQVAQKNDLLLSIAHPWGLSYDSAAYLMGEKRLHKLVAEGEIGVEAFNGMFGQVGYFFYGTNWVRKPLNFFDFLEKSRIGRKTRLSRLGRKAREKLDEKGREIIERCVKPMELAQHASFFTAGSDAHSNEMIGAGVMKIKISGKLSEKNILDAIREKKNIEFVGPFVKKTKAGNYGIAMQQLHKKQFLSGLRYATKRAVVKKLRLRRK
jgi:hypothetical protein